MSNLENCSWKNLQVGKGASAARPRFLCCFVDRFSCDFVV